MLENFVSTGPWIVNSWWPHDMETLSPLLAFSTHYWPFVRGIHRSWGPHPTPLTKSQYCTALMFALLSAWINHWTNSQFTSDLRCHDPHVTVKLCCAWTLLDLYSGVRCCHVYSLRYTGVSTLDGTSLCLIKIVGGPILGCWWKPIYL